MFVYLIRHGQKELHAGDPGLTTTGIKQARETGHYLKQFPISKILVSPFKRTVETATHISEALKINFETNDLLVERMNWNDKSVSREDFLKEWIKATNNREYQPRFGSSSLDTGRRIENLINSVLEKDLHLAIVSHGGAILDYLRNKFGDKQVEVLRTKYDEGEDYQMMNCSINRVELSAEPTIKLLNFTGHLSESSE